MSELKDRLYNVVHELIHEGELTSFVVSSSPPPDWPFPNDQELWLIVEASGERFVLPLVAGPAIPWGQRETIDQMEARVRSALQDWIAESGFGWGEQR